MSWLKKVGKKLGHGISKGWKKLTGTYHHKHKKHKYGGPSIFGGCCGAKRTSCCSRPARQSSCSRGARPQGFGPHGMRHFGPFGHSVFGHQGMFGGPHHGMFGGQHHGIFGGHAPMHHGPHNPNHFRFC